MRPPVEQKIATVCLSIALGTERNLIDELLITKITPVVACDQMKDLMRLCAVGIFNLETLAPKIIDDDLAGTASNR